MTEEAKNATLEPRVAFLFALASELHELGTSAPGLEAMLASVAARWGLELRTFAVPTAVFLGLGPTGDAKLAVIGAQPGSVADLARLTQVADIAHAVADGRVEPEDGHRRLRGLAPSRPMSFWRLAVVHAAAGAATAVILGSMWREVILVAGLGVVVALLVRFAVGRTARLLEMATGLVVGGLAVMLSRPEDAPVRSALAAILALVPGLSITVAVHELTQRHLAAGTARLSGALVQVLMLAFGLALGARMAGLRVLELGAPIERAWWVMMLASAGQAVAYAAMLRVPRRDLVWVVALCVSAVMATRASARWLGSDLAGFVGGLIATLASNGWALKTRRPASVLLVPGLLVLVPGGLGLRGALALYSADLSAGYGLLAQVAMLATSLVAALVVGETLWPREVARGGARLREYILPVDVA